MLAMGKEIGEAASKVRACSPWCGEPDFCSFCFVLVHALIVERAGVLATFLLDDPNYDEDLRDKLVDAIPYFKQRIYQPLEVGD